MFFPIDFVVVVSMGVVIAQFILKTKCYVLLGVPIMLQKWYGSFCNINILYLWEDKKYLRILESIRSYKLIVLKD